ncbi:HMG box factor [Microdochium nivale]|nr:HMG box factor [Microdochium nivale]
MLEEPLQHHYRTRRASAIELLKGIQQAAEVHDSTSVAASDSSSDLLHSPVSTASTASTSREVHQEENKHTLSCYRLSQSAKISLCHKQQLDMATMTDGHPRHYPHLHLPQLLPHSQQQSHHLQNHSHQRHSVLVSQHGGAHSEYGDVPGSPVPLIHRPASTSALLSHVADGGRSSPHLYERSTSRLSYLSNDNSYHGIATSAPLGTEIPRSGGPQNAPRTPASPGRMSADSTETASVSLKRDRSREIKEEHPQYTLQSSASATSGQDLQNRRSDGRRNQSRPAISLYTSTDTPTPNTQSNAGGPSTASSAVSTSIATSTRSLSTANTASIGASNVPGGSAGGRELICLCTKAPKVPRPRNAFILYRQHHQANVASNNPGLANPEISKLIGEQWRDQADDVKDSWKRLAEEEKIRHQQQYPDYRYQPRRGGKSGASHGSGGRPLSSGEDPGRCNKCGGRFIATPRTPSTPITPATTEVTTPGASSGPGGPGSSGNGYSYFTPGSRVVESESLRRGSVSSISSGDSHARRYNAQPQYSLANIDEGYATNQQLQHSQENISSPESKRRRHNQNNTYPISPPVAGNYTHADPRYQPYHGWRPTGQPAGGISIHTSDQTPRSELASMLSQETHPNSDAQPIQYHYGQAPQQGSSRLLEQHHPLAAPQTPGGPSRFIQAQQPQPPPQHRQPVQQSGSTFDESLRLPPLQPQLPQAAPTVAAGHNTHDRSTMGHQYYRGQQARQRSADVSNTKATRNRLQGPSAPEQHDVWPPVQYQGQSMGQAQARHDEQTAGYGLYQNQSSTSQVRATKAESNFNDSSRWPFLMKLEALRAIQPPLSTLQSRSFETRGPVIAVEGSDIAAIRDVSRAIETALLVSQDCVVKVWSDSSLSRVQDDAAPNDNRAWPSLAKYMAKMLQWHETSEALVNYITHHPPKQEARDQSSPSLATDPTKMPVAIVSTGYSLTVSDRWAAALQEPGLTDAYSADDHWRWIATLWRGIVGADLTIYIREQHEANSDTASSVELLTASAISASNSPSGTSAGTPGTTGGEDACVMVVTMEKNRGVDEKLERRLGFEIMEWVRGGGFSAAATLRQLSSSALAGPGA